MPRKIRNVPEPKDMLIDRGILYVLADGKREMVLAGAPEHKPYRDAYRRLFGRLGYWPLDGKYRFTGKKMARAK